MKSLRFLLSAVLAIAISFALVQITQASSEPTRSGFDEIEYFEGNWQCQDQNSSDDLFRWSVTRGLNNQWLVGFVEVERDKVSDDYWRLVEDKIERFAFTGDGTFVRVNSSGWESENLIRFSGSASQKTGEITLRQTITRRDNREFHALWEKMSEDQRWSTLTDEVCTKQS